MADTTNRRPTTLVIGAVALLSIPAPGLAETLEFRIGTVVEGVHAVSHSRLVAAGLPDRPFPTSGIRGVHGDGEIPLWIDGGEDGSFGDGDRIEFIGRRLPGEASHYNRFTDTNVYRLRFSGTVAEGDPPHRFSRGAEPVDGPPLVPVARVHLEEEEVMVRFRPPPGRPPTDFWFWHRLNHIDPEPFSLRLDLANGSKDPDAMLRLRTQLRGWSYDPVRRNPQADQPALADHRVELSVDAEAVAAGEWNGQENHIVEASLPLRRALADGPVTSLNVKVPERREADGKPTLVDVSLLDWIELEYPLEPRVPERQARWFVESTDPAGDRKAGLLRLDARPGSRVAIYDTTRRWSFELPPDGPQSPRIALALGAGTELFLVPDGDYQEPESVELDRPSDLRSPHQQADYLVISHHTLMEAVEPLAQAHRDNGLSVREIDVRDVYDEFSGGIVTPEAIRQFLIHARSRWQAPAPRFVLLVGDASWDAKNERVADTNYADWTFRPGEPVTRFRKNRSTSLEQGPEGSSRNLIPTWSYWGFEGHAASDNWFAAIEGDDRIPDLAIGRFPVTSPEEVGDIVDKLLAYRSRAGVGPWKARALLIANETRGAHRRSDRVASLLSDRGYASAKVYPQPSDEDNSEHQQRLVRAFDEGNFLVHFYGHGGRYIWRTGPPDPKKNHDLFTLDHVDGLRPHPELPVVLSMTCYSAPFDHPTADSIGEKFLRVPARGAVGVIAASWRNSPSIRFSESLTEALLTEETLGEAFVSAKRRERREVLLETYNLLGDPAMRLARPSAELRMVSLEDAAVRLDLPWESFDGRALVEWLTEDGQVAGTREVAIRGTTASLDPPDLDGLEVIAARSYAWDVDRQIDAVGLVELTPPSDGEERLGGP